MQIHELNNYNGDLNGSAFMAIDNGEDTGKISVVGLLADVNNTVNELDEDLNGRIDNIIAGGAAPSEAEVTDARRGTDGIVYSSLGAAIRGQIEICQDEEAAITRKLLLVKSDNLIEDDSDITAGYVAQNGTVYTHASLGYTPKIKVNEGDVLRVYTYSSGAFTQQNMRFVCAYDASGAAVSASGVENVTTFTVPSGIRFVTISFTYVSGSVSQIMVTKNKSVTAYEAYFDPYYLATEEFIQDALGDGSLPEETVKGYNLIPAGDDGEGFYYGNSIGTSILFSSSSSYHYVVVPVKPNTDYYLSETPRFIALTDDSDVVTWFAEYNSATTQISVINTGSATKLYYSISAGVWNNASLYGPYYQLVISEGIFGTYYNEKKPNFVNDLTQNMTAAKYGCALPRRRLQFTVDADQKWYIDNYRGLKSNIIVPYLGSYVTLEDDGFSMDIPSTPITGSNLYGYRAYDQGLSVIAQQMLLGGDIKAKNLQDCSILAIGDSTIASANMLANIADNFTESGKTAAFIGTRGTAPYKNEGRGGWSAKNYCTEASVNGVTNPFYNTGSQEFDFGYYMTQQGYNSVDFVIIQLGINDLYTIDFIDSDDVIIETAGYITEIIDSILDYNSAQKILLNLPTALNADQTKHKHRMLDLLRNMFVRYNEYIQTKVYDYSFQNVRCSYCHLILDPTSDITDDVHPNADGYKKMADEVTSQINCWQN